MLALDRIEHLVDLGGVAHVGPDGFSLYSQSFDLSGRFRGGLAVAEEVDDYVCTL